MTAIPKTLAIANPKHVYACVATVAGVISSKFAIDAVCNEKDDTDMDKPFTKAFLPTFEERKCVNALEVCEKSF